jgi:hypothetical protein
LKEGGKIIKNSIGRGGVGEQSLIFALLWSSRLQERYWPHYIVPSRLRDVEFLTRSVGVLQASQHLQNANRFAMLSSCAWTVFLPLRPLFASIAGTIHSSQFIPVLYISGSQPFMCVSLK